MKKILLSVFAAVVALIAILLIVGSMQPAAYHVEREVAINAPAAKVYALVSDFNRFGEWSPWEKLDPAIRKTVQGPPGTVNSFYAWEGNDQVGAGKMTITSVKPGERLDIKLDFLRPFASTSTTSWAIADDAGKSRMTWSMDGTNDTLLTKTMCLFMNMDKMLGKDFDAGLAKAKEIAEHDAAVTVP